MAKEHNPLPTPATAPEIYAHEIAMQLRALNANLEKLTGIIQAACEPVVDVATDEVELKEPAKAVTAIGAVQAKPAVAKKAATGTGEGA